MPTETTSVQVDVLIVGSGPIGAVFARELINYDWKTKTNIKVLMVDIGPQDSLRIGDHKKNSVAAQKDVSLFTNVVKGQLQRLSVPTAKNTSKDKTAYISSGKNPAQDEDTNLKAAAASRVVGGMGSHWTCCTPEQDQNERAAGFEKVYEHYARARELFSTTVTGFDHSVRQQLIMHTLAKATTRTTSANERPRGLEGLTIQAMPLACRRTEKNTNYVEWTCPATILDSSKGTSQEQLSKSKYSAVPTKNAIPTIEKFQIWPNTQCEKLNLVNNQVVSASLKHLVTNEVYEVRAQKFVICAGAVLTPGILWNSGFGHVGTAKNDALYVPNLGKNLTEQTMAFGQVLLWKAHVDSVRTSTKNTNTPRPEVYDPVGKIADSSVVRSGMGAFWKENRTGSAASTWNAIKSKLETKVTAHLTKHPKDPLPFPDDDPDPQCYFPYHVSDLNAPLGHPTNRPWHTQIHRDAFGYGEVPDHIDQRRVVDLRWFGYTNENPDNYVSFSSENRDEFDMPQPTFHFTEIHRPAAQNASDVAKADAEKKKKDDEARRDKMLEELVRVGNVLGSWIKEPDFLEPGSAIHICGTYKAGHPAKPGDTRDMNQAERDEANKDSVVDEFGRMWKHKNVVLGGCGVIPRRNACNPTLTAACFAIHAVIQMGKELDK